MAKIREIKLVDSIPDEDDYTDNKMALRANPQSWIAVSRFTTGPKGKKSAEGAAKRILTGGSKEWPSETYVARVTNLLDVEGRWEVYVGLRSQHGDYALDGTKALVLTDAEKSNGVADAEAEEELDEYDKVVASVSPNASFREPVTV